MNSTRGNIVNTPSTLVYTLLNEKLITFEQFYLIIRGNHAFMVESVQPNPELKTVHVKLNYQASVSNAIAKLGALASSVSVCKLNTLVHENEYAELDQLRKHFGIGQPDGVPSTSSAGGGRVGRRGPLFAAGRPKPYKQPKKKQQHQHVSFDETSSPPDVQELSYVPTQSPILQSQFYIGDNSENEE